MWRGCIAKRTHSTGRTRKNEENAKKWGNVIVRGTEGAKTREEKRKYIIFEFVYAS